MQNQTGPDDRPGLCVPHTLNSYGATVQDTDRTRWAPAPSSRLGHAYGPGAHARAGWTAWSRPLLLTVRDGLNETQFFSKESY